MSIFGDKAWDIARLFFNHHNLIDRRLFLEEYIKYVNSSQGDDLFKRIKIYELMNRVLMLAFDILQSEWHYAPCIFKERVERQIDLLLNALTNLNKGKKE